MLNPDPLNRTLIHTTASLSTQLQPVSGRLRGPYTSKGCGASGGGAGSSAGVVLPIHPTATLSTQPQPYPPNRNPIHLTATLSTQPQPYPPNRNPIHTTTASLATQPQKAHHLFAIAFAVHALRKVAPVAKSRSAFPVHICQFYKPVCDRPRGP